jgi:DNA-binding NarL/FixJ family response regulator
MNGSFRVLLVEDEPRTAQAITLLLRGAGFQQIEVASTAALAEMLLRQLEPDLTLLDLQLPDRDGIDVIVSSRRAGFRRPILVLTSVTDGDRVLDAVRAGADGYLFKDELDSRLVAALAELGSGGAPLSPGASLAVVRALQLDAPRAALPSLTPKEKDVLETLASGGSYSEIAGALGVKVNTVRTHIRSLYEKLGVENRAEAVNLGWSLGLLRRGS